ncbi:MAG: hypothetical protein IPM98_15695 [Lewinellaceae bacterium]|nr:hypothetical protein [Lewinellaceae bacterium]
MLAATDVQDNIFESNNKNNITASAHKVTIAIKELPLDTLSTDQLIAGTSLYYRIEVPDSLAGETMLLTLNGLAPSGTNELYLSHNAIPSRAGHDYSFSNADLPDQKFWCRADGRIVLPAGIPVAGSAASDPKY